MLLHQVTLKTEAQEIMVAIDLPVTETVERTPAHYVARTSLSCTFELPCQEEPMDKGWVCRNLRTKI